MNFVDDVAIDVDERLQHYHRSLHEQQKQQRQKQKQQQQVQIQTKPQFGTRAITIDHSQRKKRFTQQRSILKNSTERSSNQEDEQELLEAKKQLILRRRRLFSHYRQYEQWRRRQFSYDPCYYPAIPLTISQQAAYNPHMNVTNNNSIGRGAFRRRRQYRRQFSCAEREDSRESRESSSLQRCKGGNMIASDSFNVDSHHSFEQRSQWLQQQHQHLHQRQQQHRHEQSMQQQCYSPTGTRRSHFHMLHEERSASISERCTRSRINSAIFVSSEGRGFDSVEFLRRHGSQSVLCRKARSAENITDNGHKKSFSDNKPTWRTGGHHDSDLNAKQSRQSDCDGSAIELREFYPNNANHCTNICGNESRTLSVLTANTNCDHPSTSAAAAASMSITNVVVGSISLEAPPAHIKEELHNGCSSSTTSIDVNATNANFLNDEKRQRPTNFAGISKKSSASRDSADTVEELVLAPTVAVATAVVVPEIVAVGRSRSLVRQRSTTASISPHRSPKTITLKNPRTKIAALPMVSVSGPSPPQEKPLSKPPATTGTECL